MIYNGPLIFKMSGFSNTFYNDHAILHYIDHQ